MRRASRAPLYASLCEEHLGQLRHTSALAQYGAALNAALQHLIVLAAPISTARPAVDAIHDATAACDGAKRAAEAVAEVVSIHAGWAARQNSGSGAEHGIYDQRNTERTSCGVLCVEGTARLIESINGLRVDIAHAAHAAPGASLHDRIRLLHAAAPIIEGSSLAPSRGDVAAAQRSGVVTGIAGVVAAHRVWIANMAALRDAHSALQQARNILAVNLGGEPLVANERESAAAVSPALSPASATAQVSTLAAQTAARVATTPEISRTHPLLSSRPRNNWRYSPPRRTSPNAASTKFTRSPRTPTTSSPLSKTNFAAGAAFQSPQAVSRAALVAMGSTVGESPAALENELVRRDEHIALLSDLQVSAFHLVLLHSECANPAHNVTRSFPFDIFI